VVNVFGDDLDQLDAAPSSWPSELAHVHGNADVQVKRPPGAPLLSVALRPERLVQFGFQCAA
jgi:Cu/Ag efflux pump CusA